MLAEKTIEALGAYLGKEGLIKEVFSEPTEQACASLQLPFEARGFGHHLQTRKLEREVMKAYMASQRRHFLVVTGESGAGKSTLIGDALAGERCVLQLIVELVPGERLNVQAAIFEKLEIDSHPGGIEALLDELATRCQRDVDRPVTVYIDLRAKTGSKAMTYDECALITLHVGSVARLLTYDTMSANVIVESSVSQVSDGLSEEYAMSQILAISPLRFEPFKKAFESGPMGMSDAWRKLTETNVSKDQVLEHYYWRHGGNVRKFEKILAEPGVRTTEALKLYVEEEYRNMVARTEDLDDASRRFLLKVAHAGPAGLSATSAEEDKLERLLLERNPSESVVHRITHYKVAVKHRAHVFLLLGERKEALLQYGWDSEPTGAMCG